LIVCCTLCYPFLSNQPMTLPFHCFHFHAHSTDNATMDVLTIPEVVEEATFVVSRI
jgi:hypothetical protein